MNIKYQSSYACDFHLYGDGHIPRFVDMCIDEANSIDRRKNPDWYADDESPASERDVRRLSDRIERLQGFIGHLTGVLVSRGIMSLDELNELLGYTTGWRGDICVDTEGV